jgi:uncharacterized protein YggE
MAALVTVVALGACGQRETLLAVNASAVTRTTPDLAIVTLGVLARGATARLAQQAQAARMEAVMAAVTAAGAAEPDVQTVGFSLEPQYAYSRNAAPRITGYVSRNVVSIRLRDLNAVSALVDATVAEGANELRSIQFGFANAEASRAAARAEALQTARARANAYAEAANMRVVRIDAIIEPGSALPGERRRDGYALGAVAVAVEQHASSPISPGAVDSEAMVTLIFALQPR